MRCATDGQYPKWLVFENVPGLLNADGGNAMRVVLEEFLGIIEEQADVPMPENGKWLPAGEIMGNACSLAWRTLDAAQGWGVAQRRKRVFVVVDLTGGRAGKVLFESEGMSGYTPPRREAGQGAAQGAEGCLGATGQYGGVTASGFCTEHSADSRGIGYEEERSPTLRAGVVPGIAIEYNPTDSRIKVKEDGICQTLCSRMGTGGNCVPLTLKIRSGCEGGGKGALIQKNMSATLACNNDQTLFQPVAFGISSDQSNAMLSDNPRAGIYEADTSRTLDCNGGSPVCHQGGVAICQPVYAVRTRLNTDVHEDVTPTLMARDYKDPAIVSGPAYCMTVGSYGNVAEEKTPTLEARGYKDPPVVSTPNEEQMPEDPTETEYLVRRLTPRECCALQGFEPGWTENLGTEEPTEQEIAWWSGVFAEWNAVNGKKNTATRNKIIKWLKDPSSDSAEYRAFGNSVAVPCVHFVLAGIVWAEGLEAWN